MEIKSADDPFEFLVEHIACNYGSNGAIDCMLIRDELPEGFSRIRDFHIPLDLKTDLCTGMLAKVLARDIELETIYPSTSVLKSGVRVGDLFCDALANRPTAIGKTTRSIRRQHRAAFRG